MSKQINGFECPNCGHRRATVYNTRQMSPITKHRQRKCHNCGHNFDTYEVLVEPRRARVSYHLPPHGKQDNASNSQTMIETLTKLSDNWDDVQEFLAGI